MPLQRAGRTRAHIQSPIAWVRTPAQQRAARTTDGRRVIAEHNGNPTAFRLAYGFERYPTGERVHVHQIDIAFFIEDAPEVPSRGVIAFRIHLARISYSGGD